MSFADFEASLRDSRPPCGLNPALAGLWHDAKGDWVGAHRCVQNEVTAEAAWVHAYLHRKEGDGANAAYWYARAGRPVAAGRLDAEWKEIAAELARG